jgi:nucleoid DNA-binding protein
MLKAKTELNLELKDKNNVYTTYGIFKNIEKDMNEDLSKLKNCDKRKITYEDFRKVIWLYFKFVISNLLDGKRFRLHNRFGELRLTKRKVDRFLPKVNRIRTVDGKRVSEKVDPLEYMKKFNWFWYYLNWDVGKKWRTHEFKQGKRFNTAMLARVERGFDYIDYTPRYKGEGIIRKIK